MTEDAATAPAAETEADFGADAAGVHARWVAEIEAFDRERRAYADRVEKIIKRYTNEHGGEDRRFALLWANVEVLKPTVYARDPLPRVFRRFRDRDPVGRVAGTLLERSLTCQIEKHDDFGQAMRAAVLDYLLIGQGVAWAFYEPTFTEQPMVQQAMVPDGMGAPVMERIATDERVRLGAIHWKDFGFTAGARGWPEVTAVWRKAYMTREELVTRFGEAGEGVPLDRAPVERRDGSGATDVIGKATVYEIWDSAKREVVWLHKGVHAPLDAQPYPLKLRGKFPCPRPLFATLTTGSMVPIPDFIYYQDQALELDDLTARIAVLSKAMKLIGFVPGETQPDIQKGLDSGQEVALVPVESWAVGQGRPMDNAISWLPVAEVASTLARLVELREAIKQDAYEVTGLSDILRGSTAASETATAQQIKAQWGSIRVRDRQQEVARFARECIEIMADIVCGHFDPERIAAEANAEALPPSDAPNVIPALQLLKGEGALRAYRVDVETDSTIAPDEQGERQAATELLTGVSSYLTATMPLIQGVATQAPQAMGPMSEMIGGLLTQAVRRFRGGEEAEELIEKAMQALSQPAQQAAGQQGPGPEGMAMQAEAAKAQAAQEAAMMDVQARQQIEAGKAQVQMQIEQMRLEAENARHQAELSVRLQIAEMQSAQKAADGERAAAMKQGPAVAVSLSQETERAVSDALTPLAEAAVQVTQAAAVSSEAAQATTQAAAQMAQATQAIAEAARAMAAPREIVRGPDGRATGVRAVMQ